MSKAWIALVVALMATPINAGAQSLVERGDYLVNVIGVCTNCHTPREKGVPDKTKWLSGGFQTFDEPWFVVKGANLTSDRETGLGAWTDADIKRAMLQGVRPNGTPLAAVMPFPLYGVMMPSDADAIVAYLRTLPAIRSQVQAPVYKTEQPKEVYPDAAKPMTEADLKTPAGRGAYLAGLGHCMACHARRTADQAPDYKGAWGAGGRVFKTPAGEAIASNISQHKGKGLGAWTDAELRRVFTDGVSRDGRKLKPPMADHLVNWKNLRPDDIDALVAWMKTIPAIE